MLLSFIYHRSISPHMHLKLLRLLPILSFFALPSLVSAQSGGCNYSLIMKDAFGDGWNGGILNISVNGVGTDYTLSTGTIDTVSFAVNDGDPIIATWTGAAFIYEVSYQIQNNIGQVVSEVQAPFMPSSGVVYSDAVHCISCAPPVNFYVDNIWDTSVKLRWSANPISPNPAVVYQVVYGLQGFDLAAGEGDTLSTGNTKLTITGLQKKTSYDAYLVQDCGSGAGFSDVLGPISFQTYWTNDVGISGVVSPVSSCDLSLDTVRVLLKNYGAAPQSLIPLRFTINGEDVPISKPSDGFYTGVLGKDSAEVFVFETLGDFSEPGEYVIKAFTKMSTDQDVSNDTFVYRLNNRLVTPYTQHFQDWDGGWTVQQGSVNSDWEYGTPDKADIPAVTPDEKAWVTSLAGNYSNNQLSYLESPCFDFTDLTYPPAMTFSLAHHLEDQYDGAWLELSTDNGDTWTKVGALGEGLNWYTEDITDGTAAGESWSGNSNGWVPVRHFLNGAAGHSNVRLRFAFASDVSVQFGGMGIDDVRIFPAFSKDLAGVKVNAESEDQECGSATDHVTLTFLNVGNLQQNNFKVAYSVNGGTPVIENYAPGIAPDQQAGYTFNVPFDSRDAVSVIKCWTMVSGDFAPANDTATLILNHVARQLPFHADFEDQQIPQGWVSDGFVNNGHGNSSYVLSVNLYSFHPESIHEIPRYTGVGAGDSLTFSYRITNFSGGGPGILALGTKIEAQVSTDCGETWQTINSVNSANHTPTLNMRTRTISLAQFAGQAIKIRFLSTWTSGDLWIDLDNINVLACAADMNLSADITPATVGQNNGAASINVGLGNPPYTYAWSDGTTSQSQTGLAAGTYTVTVTDAHGCSGSFEFSVETSAVKEIEGLTLFSIQPNPTEGPAVFHIAFRQNISNAKLEALNLLGQPVWSAETSNTPVFNGNLDLSAFPPGLYLLRLTADGRMATKKLIKN